MKKLVRILRIVADKIPLTVGGLFVGGFAALAFWLGFGEVDYVYTAGGAIAAGVLAYAILITAITFLFLWLALRRVRVEAPDLKLECGYRSRTNFSIMRVWFVPFIEIRWRWLEPPAYVTIRKEGWRLTEEVLPYGRGQRDVIVRRIEVGDSFGLCRMAFESRQDCGIQVLPSVGGLKAMHVVRSLSGGDEFAHPEGRPDGERIDIRNYNPGDPIKYVLWKVFARSRQLVVRTPERALSAARQTVAYLVAADGDEPAAGAARVAVGMGALGGDWTFGADGVAKRATTKHDALVVLAQSGEAQEPEFGAGLGAFLKEASPDSSGRAVVFVPGIPGPWLDRLVAQCRSFGSQGGHAPMEFIVSTDGIERGGRRGLVRKMAYRAPSRGHDGTVKVMSEELAQVVEKLSALRAKILIIDRRDGRVYGEEHYKRLEAA